MSEPLPPWLANLDPRFVRPDWKKWLRPDWQTWMPPGARYDKPAPRPEFARLYKPYRDEAPAPPRRATGLTEADILFFRSNLAALRFKLALLKWRIKAGYDEDEPRDERGRWTDEASGEGATGDQSPSPTEAPRSAPLRITIYPRSLGEGESLPAESPPAEPAPTIPPEEPPTAQLRNRVVKQVARWALRTALRTASGRLGAAVLVLEAALWLHEFLPYIQAYVDPAKTLQELQQAVSERKKGYDVHHIVEQTDAELYGFPRALIHGRTNLVRIPTLKHWEITGWYMRPNWKYGGRSPRSYLRGKSWEERYRVGIEALIEHGVLKP